MRVLGITLQEKKKKGCNGLKLQSENRAEEEEIRFMSYTPTRGDHHRRQLARPDPSNQCFLLHKPSQCSFQPVGFILLLKTYVLKQISTQLLQLLTV